MQQDKTQNAKVPQDRQKQPVQQKQSAQQQQNFKQPNQQKQQMQPKQQNQPKQAMQPQQRPQQPQQKPQPMPQVQPRPQQTQQPMQPKDQSQKRADDNTVFVGQKPSMAYVLAVMTQFNSGKSEVHVRARGKAISRAVDVAEIVRRKFMSSMRMKEIRIGTEEYELEGKGRVPVSTIEIVLCK
jgi:DNA-binding protein Alba